MFLRLLIYFYFFTAVYSPTLLPKPNNIVSNFVIRRPIDHTSLLQTGAIVIITITIWAYVIIERTWFFAFFHTNTLFLPVCCCALTLFVSLVFSRVVHTTFARKTLFGLTQIRL